MKYSHIICHYSEIGLKGKNRPFFVKTLQNNSIEQRTEEWYKKRTTMITASDCGTILGYNSKFTTSNDLLTNKLNNVRREN